jgi:hypothetical protein
MGSDSILSERALREVYLMPFMLAQKYAKPWCFMTSSVSVEMLYSMFTDRLSFVFLATTVSMAPMPPKTIAYCKAFFETSGSSMG